MQIERYIVWIALFSIVLVVLAIVTSRPAFRQERNFVVIREPGHRFLGPPQPAHREAAIDLDYALFSLAAYGDIKKNKDDKEAPRINAKELLDKEGWRIYSTFPGTCLQKKMDAVHLRAEVWTNRSKGSVVVAFGGTVFSSWKDWKSNLHWLDPFQHDEYSLIVSEFGPEFVKALALQTEISGLLRSHIQMLHPGQTNHPEQLGTVWLLVRGLVTPLATGIVSRAADPTSESPCQLIGTKTAHSRPSQRDRL